MSWADFVFGFTAGAMAAFVLAAVIVRRMAG